MSVLNHLAQAAAVIMLIELLVVILIFLGISGGLAFGLRWVNGKTDWAFGKVNGYLPTVRRYVHLATGWVAQPIISVAGFMEAVEGTLAALQRIVRQSRQPPPPPPVAARPVPPPVQVTERNPIVSDATAENPIVSDATAENPLAIP